MHPERIEDTLAFVRAADVRSFHRRGKAAGPVAFDGREADHPAGSAARGASAAANDAQRVAHGRRIGVWMALISERG